MSNELDKLAAELHKLKPSKRARARAMEAAMSAFSEEFLPEMAAAKVNAKTDAKIENNSDVAQGISTAPRPTTRVARESRVQSLGTQKTSKFSSLFNFKPQTMMMAGSCAAALIAGLIILPNLGSDDIAVQGSDSVGVVAEGQTNSETAVIDLGTLSGLLDEPNVVTIERRVLKMAGRVESRLIPAEYGTIERRILLNPERAQWREYPQTPEEIAAGAPISYERINEPAEFKTETEEFLLRQASEEFVKIPPIYETVKETIWINADGSTKTLISEILPSKENEVVITADLNKKSTSKTIFRERRVVKRPARTVERVIPPVTRQETQRIVKDDGTFETIQETGVVGDASTELVTIPATYETIRETIEVQADGTEKVVSSEIIPPPTESQPQGSSGSIAENRKRASYAVAAAPSQTRPTVNTRTRGQFNVFNGVSNQVVESTETIVSQAGEVLCRVLIPAKYKTITKEVMVTSAYTIDRPVPAVTKDVTVTVETEDGGFKDVTKTFVIQDATTETLVIPAKFKTHSERVLIEPAREEWKPANEAINYGAFGVQPEPALRNDPFEDFDSNPVTAVADTPVSRFAMDVDTSSYNVLRAAVKRGQLPPRGAVRLEEMINYFPYDYAAPKSADTPFKANVTITATPWNAETNLMHIGIKGYVPMEAETLSHTKAGETNSAPMTIAKDVKIQVEFNSEKISNYRLIGYETRALNRQDFNNDKVNAGEISAGHSVTAIYEVTPVSSPSGLMGKLRSFTDNKKTKGANEYASVKIHHKLPNAETSAVQVFPISARQEKKFRKASDDMRFAVAVSAVGQKLRGEAELEDFTYEDAIALARKAKGEDKNGYRAEFIQMVRLIDGLGE